MKWRKLALSIWNSETFNKDVYSLFSDVPVKKKTKKKKHTSDLIDIVGVGVKSTQVFIENGATNSDFYDQVHPSTSGHLLLGRALAEALADEK